jgi:hypothetical protein
MDGNINHMINWRPNYDGNPISYKFPLAVVEGKPVFVGDELYWRGSKTKISEYANGLDGLQDWSWNPPKPATVMVELPRSEVEYLASFENADCIFDVRSIAKSCRKALEAK